MVTRIPYALLLAVAVLGAALGGLGLGGGAPPDARRAREAAAPAPAGAGTRATVAIGEAGVVDATDGTTVDTEVEVLAQVLSALPFTGLPRDDLSEAERLNRDAVERSEGGDLAAAIALLRRAHRLEPWRELYRANLQAVLINAGFASIAGERFAEAAAHLAEALGLGDRGEVRRGLGYAYYRLGQVDLARASLERAVAEDAADAETFVTLGRIYLEQRDQGRALDAFERALAAGATHPGLAETVARLRRDAEVEQGYLTLASSHFVLKYQGREHTAAGREVLSALEDAYRRVGARFAYYPLEPLEVILYPDDAFRAVTDSPHWSGGVFDGRIKLPLGGLRRGREGVARTLRHEYAHAAIVTLSRGRAPVWLNEGLAQVAEETGDRGRGIRLRQAVGARALLPLVELERGFTRFDRTAASLAYAQAHFAAHWLLETRGGYNVRRLLETMATAPSVDDAFRQALSMSYEDFERRLVAEIERRVG